LAIGKRNQKENSVSAAMAGLGRSVPAAWRDPVANNLLVKSIKRGGLHAVSCISSADFGTFARR